ncbi:RNA helicase [Cyanobium sp. FGCU-6]|nr:RNA helicase [Cyanobium sp. FGCU6]
MDRYGGDTDFPRSEGRRGPRREADPLEQKLDRWVSAGRQFVEGVSGARPGTRAGSREPGGRTGGGTFRPADLGRWVENRLDRLLEDDGDDWREPWQEPNQIPAALTRASSRRPLEAISRRLQRPQGPAPAVPADDWPADDAFTLPRWQRPVLSPAERDRPLPPSEPPAAGSRPLPRSSRRR